jgi:hypothetical protein
MESMDQNLTGKSAQYSNNRPGREVPTPPSTLRIEHTIRDPELIAEILAYPEGRIRADFIDTCLRIGALALRQAEGQIDAQVVRKEGEQLMAELQRALNAHRDSVVEQIGSSLKSYFDPDSGRLEERFSRLLKHGGELEQLMRRQIGADDSEIARTLAAHIGESSPFLKLLDPESSNGVIHSMAQVLDKALTADSERIIGEFSLDKEDSALSRFLRAVSDKQGEMTGNLQESIKLMVDEFSLDKEDSALSRLVRQVDTAQKQISAEFTLDSDTSALARMRKELLELMEKSNADSQKMLRDIHGLVQSLHVRKEEAARSTTHGEYFETGLYRLLDRLSRDAGDIVTATGNSTGTIRNCKKGDVVVEIGKDHVSAGSKIVFEAKDVASCTVHGALAEIDEARKNRDADIGVFIFSRSTAPEGLTTFRRYGKDILAVWDLEDPDSDIFVEVALSLAKGLCSQAAGMESRSQADLAKMNDAIRDIEKQAGYFEEIITFSETIRRSGRKIIDRVSTMRDKILGKIHLLDTIQEDLKNSE